MGGGEKTDSSATTNRPLTAAERQDLYRSSIGNILNTYQESGLPYGGTGSMTPNATNATFNPNPTTGTMYPGGSSGFSEAGGMYNASGSAGGGGVKTGGVTLNPMTAFQVQGPDVSMPTGAADPGGINMPVYQTPQYQQPGSYKDPGSYQPAGSYSRLANGDYDTLQSAMLKGSTAPLDAAKATDIQRSNDSAAARGIWSSGLAEQLNTDVSKAYAPQYEKAGADSTAARYAAETADNTGANNFNQTGAAATNSYNLANSSGENSFNQTAAQNANNFNVTNANNSYQAGWTPLTYLQGLWNGTSGQTSGTSSFGQSLEFKV